MRITSTFCLRMCSASQYWPDHLELDYLVTFICCKFLCFFSVLGYVNNKPRIQRRHRVVCLSVMSESYSRQLYPSVVLSALSTSAHHSILSVFGPHTCLGFCMSLTSLLKQECEILRQTHSVWLCFGGSLSCLLVMRRKFAKQKRSKDCKNGK